MTDYIIYILAGVVAGFLNTIAGGGTLITLPILIFMGMPGTVANATLRVGILTQNIFATGGFHSKGVKLPFPYIIYLCIVSLVGGIIGANSAVSIQEDLFRKIMAVIMVFAVISIMIKRKKVEFTDGEKLSWQRQVIGSLGFFLLGIYGGFIQAGIGFLVIALLMHLNHFSLVKTNYIKVFAAIMYTGVSLVVFSVAGKILWKEGLILAVGQGIGAWFTSRWSVDVGDKWIKRILVVVVAGLAVKLWFFN